MADEPAWLNSNVPQQDSGAASNNSVKNASSGSSKTNGVTSYKHFALKFGNVAMAVFTAATGVYGIFTIQDLKIQDAFISVYLMLFAILLFIYETMMPCTKDSMRKHFGFLHGLKGRGLFLIFIGILCFGLGIDLAYGCGAAGCFMGVMHFAVYFMHGET